MPKRLTEAQPITIVESLGGGVFELQIITPGLGSSGLYPESTLKEAVANKVFAKGTHIYLDHPTITERQERPERSVRDLAGSLQEDGRWNGGAIVAKARIYTPYRPLLAEAAPDIGMSIVAYGEVSDGIFEGQAVPQVDELTECASVDFVTHAGRGGKVLSVIESARIGEVATDDRREQIMRALPPRSWLRDYDPDQNEAYYATYDSRGDKSIVYAQSFTIAEDGQSISFVGQAQEVRVVTTYVPVTQPATTSESTSHKEMIKMPEIAAERLAELEKAAARVPQLESELTTEKQRADAEKTRADEAARKIAEAELTKAARKVAEEKTKDLHSAVRNRVIESVLKVPANIPTKNEGALDESEFDKIITESITVEKAYLAELAPAGVQGFGVSAAQAVSESRPARTTNAWNRPIKKEA